MATEGVKHIIGMGNGEGGTSSDELNEKMQPYRHVGYLGAIPWDQIPLLPIKPQSRCSWIMNLDSHEKAGSHWCAVYIDARPEGDQTIEYYDPFAVPMHQAARRRLLDVQEKLNPTQLLKFKENRVCEQKANKDTCGEHAMSFLIRRYRGKPFPEASGFIDRSKEGEQALKTYPEFRHLLK